MRALNTALPAVQPATTMLKVLQPANAALRSLRPGVIVRGRLGLTLVELLIALTITAVLLTAMAVAVNATMTNYTQNQQIAAATVGARNVLRRICTEIRTAQNDAATAPILISGGGTQCSFTDAGGGQVVYKYEADNDRLVVQVGGNWHALLQNVRPAIDGEAIFSSTAPSDPSWPAGTVGKVLVRFKVEQGNVARAISAAVVPRNILYGP